MATGAYVSSLVTKSDVKGAPYPGVVFRVIKQAFRIWDCTCTGLLNVFALSIRLSSRNPANPALFVVCFKIFSHAHFFADRFTFCSSIFFLSINSCNPCTLASIRRWCLQRRLLVINVLLLRTVCFREIFSSVDGLLLFRLRSIGDLRVVRRSSFFNSMRHCLAALSSILLLPSLV